jgi:hypothetical protein
MIARETRAATLPDPAPEHALIAWMSQHGNTALTAELALLGVCTVGAIATDDYWQRRAR